MATAIIIVVMLLTLIHFYLKCSLMTSFSTMMASVFALIITFTYYEKLADLFISRGYGVNWAHFGCFVLAFILGFALMRALADLLVGTNIDLGKQLKVGASVVCGLFTGVIISGSLLVAMGLLPMQGKVFYTRYAPDKPVTLTNPQKPFIGVDSFVVGFYKLVSSGSLSSGKSFGVLHADYLDQIHLNRLKIQNKVLTVGSSKALVLPSEKGKNPVRIIDLPDKSKATAVKIGIVQKSIPDGGANNPSGDVQFYPAQIRLIAKQSNSRLAPLKGTAKALPPIGFLTEKGKFVGSDSGDDKGASVNLDTILPAAGIDIITKENKVVWMDVVFPIQSGYEPVLIEFKQNSIVQLPKAVASSQEVEEPVTNVQEEKKPS